ncbi:hypothetical protein [Denitrobacterium detoxificans]|uniref:hypothetical protein n=1 Tax=Denitrobacterium detoxificans TaxID=79604 RepID=UPI0026EA8FBA|nr:hypothetical protein [Denitrobacterium detoxificans]
MTSVGPITLKASKLRMGSCFPEDLIVRYSRIDRVVSRRGFREGGQQRQRARWSGWRRLWTSTA